MGILFKDVYIKAFSLIDDPKITAAYESNHIQFEKLMYSFLQNAIGMFQNPAGIAMRLSNYNEPYGRMETFEGDGKSNSFELDDSINVDVNKDYEVVFIENGRVVQGTLNKASRTVTFPDVLPEGQEYSVELYYPGEFTSDFDGLNTVTSAGNSMVSAQVKEILARRLVIAWAEAERNNILDIKGQLQDSDFKITGNDRLLNAKNSWIDQLITEINTYENRLSWAIRFTNSARRLGRG